MKTVLFVCVYNAGRSQMAAGLFNHIAQGKKAKAISAGIHPGLHVHPNAIAVLAELGIDISHEKPKAISREMLKNADLLITMGCDEVCPTLPSLKQISWDIDSSHVESLVEARKVRTQMTKLIEDLLKTLS